MNLNLSVGCRGGRCAASVLVLLVLVQFVISTPLWAADGSKVDPFMGDYEGEWGLTGGYDSGSLVAQVIALGNGEYRAKLLERFDDPDAESYGAVDGRKKGGLVEFAGRVGFEDVSLRLEATIQGGTLRGAFDGQGSDGAMISGKFELKSVMRRSPTLGAKAPKGAVVLFDGKDFDQWERLPSFSGMVNIPEIIGNADNAVAYLWGGILSEQEQKATIELGSDDGIKVWLNRELVHANNASRGVQPGQDKVEVALKQGFNMLLLKVNNGGGGWGACARLVGSDKRPLGNIKEVVSRNESTDEYLKANGGYLTVWRVAGPFKQEGKDGPALFDVAFAPEKERRGGGAEWKSTSLDKSDPKAVKWTLVDGAMQCKPGTGSIVTKGKFKDFKLHIEFRTPFMPTARGQGRGNSGVYLQGRYEVQVLDSYGLEGLDNECGGIYKVGRPLVNMCAPPMQWQTYDMTFRAPRVEGGQKKPAHVTVEHNNVRIQDKDIPGPTGGALDGNVDQPGGIYLQDHGNTVQFRNIWLEEL